MIFQLCFWCTELLFVLLLDAGEVEQPVYFTNLDLKSIVTPINIKKLEQLLIETNYNKEETQFLVEGFRSGFDIGYRGPEDRKDMSENIPITVGSEVQLWNKVMHEVQLGRYAGPFEKPPFDNFIQSPIGLVPKAGNKTRLIFHLSYDFKRNGEDSQNSESSKYYRSTRKATSSEPNSLNHHTPEEFCTVRYKDLDEAIRICFKLRAAGYTGPIYFGKTDLSSAFRQLPLRVKDFKWLLMKAKNPATGKWYFFVDKCLPFRSSISCALFQHFSDALCHIAQVKSGQLNRIINYLDDFLFIAIALAIFNGMLDTFLNICKEIEYPVALEKTEWANTWVIFLGMLMEGQHHCLIVPEEKKRKGLNVINNFIDARKTTVKNLQVLTGILNFLCKAVVPGRAFLRRMYAKIDTKRLKPHHHVSLDVEFRADAHIWKLFLENANNTSIRRPFLDLNMEKTSIQLDFYSDASKAENLGFGGVFAKDYIWGQWEPGFIRKYDPSITYLELYALTVAILSWSDRIRNVRVIIFCDNQAVVNIVNSLSSKCANCMHLIRILTLDCLKANRRIQSNT